MKKDERIETHIRAFPDVKVKLDEWGRKISVIENKRIKISEVVRRMTNIPNIDNILFKDSEEKFKRRMT